MQNNFLWSWSKTTETNNCYSLFSILWLIIIFFGSKMRGISCRQKVEEVEKWFKMNEALSWKKMMDYTQLRVTKGES